MEGKKKKRSSGGEATRSIADELFGKKGEHQTMPSQYSSSSSSAGYFSAIFPPPATVMERQRAAERQCADSEAGKQAQGGRGGGGSSKKQSKDGDVEVGYYSTEPSEPCYYGSSVHYGGRDTIYTASNNNYNSSSHSSAAPNYQNEGDQDDPNYATRGDWWQGSLYY